MAVARASSAEDIRTGTTDPHTFVFTPAGTPRGIAIAITHGVSATSLVVSVSYGGVALRRIVRATDTVTEPGMTEFWFLGSAIPTGAQTVSIDLTSGSTTDVHTVVWELSAATDTEVIDFRAINEDVANPTVVMEAASRSKISLGSLYAGGAAPGGTLATGNTADHNHDHGNFYSDSCYETTVDNAVHTIGWSTLTSDDIAFAAIAVSEVSTDPGYVDMMGGVPGSGQNVSTPDHASLDVTGSMQIIVGVAFTGTTKATSDNLITKGDPGAAAGAFTLRRPAGGRELLFAWRESGGTVRNLVTTGGTYTAVAGAFRWYKVEFVASTATGTFFYSDDLATTAVGSISWTNFGSDTDSVSSNINAGTVAMWLGGRADNPDERLDGRLFYAEVRDGIAGTIVANPDFRTDTQQDSLTQLTDDQGRVWTVTEPALWLNPRVGSTTVTPAVIAVTVTLPTPVAAAGVIVTPAAAAVTLTLPTPTASIAATVTPAPIVIGGSGGFSSGFSNGFESGVGGVTLPTPTIDIAAATTVTPAVIVATVSLPTPAVLAAVAATPAVVTPTVTLPAPTILAAAVVTPSTIAATVSVPTPAVLVTATVTPVAIAVTASLPAPTVLAAVTVISAALTPTVSLPTPTVAIAQIVTPAAVTVTVDLPTPTVLAEVVATPAAIAATVSLPSSAVLAGAIVEPAAIPLSVAPLAPTVLAEVQITPAVLEPTVSLPAPTVLAGAVVTPDAVVPVVDLPAPVAITGAGAVVTPDVIALTVALDTPTVSVPATLTPDPVAVTVALDTPTVLAAATVTPAVIPVTADLPTPTVIAGAGVTATPDIIALSVSLPAPAILAEAVVDPAVIIPTVTLPTPIAGIPATVTPATLALDANLPTPTILAAALIAPNTLALLVGVPAPTVLQGAGVTPTVIPILVTFPGPTIHIGIVPFWVSLPVPYTRNPVAATANPAGYTPVRGSDDSPWD